MNRHVRILGIRGVPAAHGGFETFAEQLALYLVKQGWAVSVYCQEDGSAEIFEDTWQGIRRIHIPVSVGGAAGTIWFDWRSTLHALREQGLVLTLGYNTAVFNLLYRLRGQANIVNMDGIEWKRQKWGVAARSWFWLNDWLGCLLGNHLIADHPEIKRHLQTRVSAKKISTIAYGADAVNAGDRAVLQRFGLTEAAYAIVIARPERENSILEIVKAWSGEPRGAPLVVLGNYDAGHEYHREVRASASAEVLFLGAIYDKAVVQSLRYFARFYIHGHQVGGTNPSLVEALAAGNAVLAHDNPFNRQVAAEGGLYFAGEDQCAQAVGQLLEDQALLHRLSLASRLQHQRCFTWAQVLADYEALLSAWVGGPQSGPGVSVSASRSTK